MIWGIMRFWWGGKWQRMNNERTNEWDATCKHNSYMFFEQFSSFRNIFDHIKEPRRNRYTLDAIAMYWTQSPLTLIFFLCWSHIDVIFVRSRYVKTAKLSCNFLTTSTNILPKTPLIIHYFISFANDTMVLISSTHFPITLATCVFASKKLTG